MDLFKVGEFLFSRQKLENNRRGTHSRNAIFWDFFSLQKLDSKNITDKNLSSILKGQITFLILYSLFLKRCL